MTGRGRLLARGTRSAVYEFGLGAVVKVPSPTTPDPWIEYEAAYAEAARSSGALAPRVLGLETVDGRTASVWERIHGRTLWELVVDQERTPSQAGQLLAEVHGTLQRVAGPVQLPRQADRLASKIRNASSYIAGGVADELALVSRISSATLCHGDLHPGNVLVAPHGPVILDWFDASRGDPAADIARSWLMVTDEGSPLHRHLPGASSALLSAVTDAYAESIGVDTEGDELFRAWVAVQAVARISEKVARPPLLAVWRSCRGALAAAVSGAPTG